MYIQKGLKKLVSEWQRNPVKFGMDIFPDFFFDTPGAVHPAMARDLLTPKEEITVLMVTRGAAKSIYGAFLMPIHKMIFQNFKYIILASLSSERARFLINDIQVGLTSERLIDVFGEFKPLRKEDPWGANKIVAVNTKIDRKCMFHARGSGSQIAGLRFEEARPQLFIGDDLEDDNTVQSDEVIDKKLNWIDDMVLPAMDPKRKEIFIIGTTYKANAMIVQLSKRKKGVNTIKYPILADLETAKKLKIEVGTSIWESRFPTAKMKKMREDANANGTLAAFMRQYMLDPTEGKIDQFREEDIMIYEPEKIANIKLNFYILVDLAYSKRKKADDTGIVAFAVDADDNIFVLEALRKKLTDSQFCTEIINILIKYSKVKGLNTKLLGIESYAFQYVKTNLRNRLNEVGLSVSMKELEPKSRKKEHRIKAMIPMCEQRKIYLQRKHSDLKSEMLRFHGEADQKELNILDALSYYKDVSLAVTVEEKIGLGSAKNHELWVQFAKDQGPVIGSAYRSGESSRREIERAY